MLERFAEEAMRQEHLGLHTQTDLLTVSFSANDHLGHAVGPYDPAVEEMSVATDAAIGRLIAAAEKQAGGRDHLVIVMTADHGVAPTPEWSLAHHLPGGRADKRQYLRTVQDALTARFGEGKWIVGTWESGFYFDQDLIRDKRLNPTALEDEAARVVQTLPYVERVYTRTQLLQRTAMASIVDDYVARSFFPERGPNLVVVTKPYWLFGTEGTSHGTPWNYDTHVPLISGVPAFVPASTQNASASAMSLQPWPRCSALRCLPAASDVSYRKSSATVTQRSFSIPHTKFPQAACNPCKPPTVQQRGSSATMDAREGKDSSAAEEVACSALFTHKLYKWCGAVRFLQAEVA